MNQNVKGADFPIDFLLLLMFYTVPKFYQLFFYSNQITLK